MFPILNLFDIKGDLDIPCEGEYFLSPSGVKFVPELHSEDYLQTLGISSEDDGRSLCFYKKKYFWIRLCDSDCSLFTLCLLSDRSLGALIAL